MGGLRQLASERRHSDPAPSRPVPAPATIVSTERTATKAIASRTMPERICNTPDPRERTVLRLDQRDFVPGSLPHAHGEAASLAFSAFSPWIFLFAPTRYLDRHLRSPQAATSAQQEHADGWTQPLPRAKAAKARLENQTP